MIDVEDIKKLVGRQIHNGLSGDIGTIIEIREGYSLPIVVKSNKTSSISYYSKLGFYEAIGRNSIKLDEPTIETVISKALTTFGLTPEELIAIILERHCG
jgi:hypothetical protein